uniref:Uncharacterized protein n=1 Tax=Angiostrongylus cantonensis TaxID=6313 RepID=A0A0K0DAS9_ANGCA
MSAAPIFSWCDLQLHNMSEVSRVRRSTSRVEYVTVSSAAIRVLSSSSGAAPGNYGGLRWTPRSHGTGCGEKCASC